MINTVKLHRCKNLTVFDSNSIHHITFICFQEKTDVITNFIFHGKVQTVFSCI